ncbi:MAG: asparagine synthase (glutamine-hydrolyzing) [Pyrinomonadaceae bacterium]|nr:asparagine synthase (glutamine-hydrolyzing) [Pyrinomonadaceae bacterium]
MEKNNFKRFCLTYNGEIYNYLELKKELETKGYKFQTNSDTEVLINAFAEWNVECLQRLNGMFAFAIWDEKEKTLTLARDRTGIKPLYYAKIGDTFLFASEIKAILASKLIKAEIDNEGLHQFLTFLWAVPPHTMFKNIWQLPPAHFAVWKNNELKTQEYWDLDFSCEEQNSDENYWSERTLETLEKCVNLEMIADVPLGAFLSGGVDSSSIVALMTKKHDKVSTYTTAISAEDLEFDIIPDDVKWSRKMAEFFPIDYHETLLTPDLSTLLPKLNYHQETPIIDMAIPSFLISEQSRNSNKVMLSGMGGDEVFAGYPRQMAMQIAGKFDFMPTAIRKPLMKTVDNLLYGGMKGKLTAPMRNAKKFAKSAAMDFENRYLGFGTYWTDEMKNRLYTKDFVGEQNGFDAYRFHKNYFEKSKNWSALNRLLYVDFKTFMPALNLDTTDKTSMAANLEVRVPFLNNEMLDLSQKIPNQLKLKGLERKFILKKACEKILPNEIIYRKKAGFGSPIRSWLRTSLQPMINDLLSVETIKKRGLFDANEVQKIIELNQSGKEDYNLQVFQLLNLEIWMQQFLD